MGLEQQARGDLHAPVRQVLHGRHADELQKAFVQGRSRKPDPVGQQLQGPVLGGAVMHQPEHTPDVAVAQPGQPAALVLRQAVQVVAQHIDEHHLAHAFEHDLAARTFAC